MPSPLQSLFRSRLQASATDAPPRRWIVLVPPVLALLAVAIAWQVFDLSSLRSLDELARAGATLRAGPWAPAYVLGGFAIAPLMFVPITALTVATALTFGPIWGFGYGFVGVCLGACTTYWAGRLLGAPALARMMGPRMARLAQILRIHVFKASALARVAPMGNFTVMNMLAGGMRVPFAPYLAGTAVGVAPGLALIALFSERAARMLREPTSRGSVVWLSLALAGALLLLFFVRRYIRRGATRGAD